MDPTIGKVLLQRPSVELDKTTFRLPPVARKAPVGKPVVESHVVNIGPDAQFVNVDHYKIFWDTVTEAADDVEARLNRLATYPFEELGRSVFTNKSSVVLANIDSVFNLTGRTGVRGSLASPQSDNDLTFIDVGGNGAFTQYVLWRNPVASGFGMSSNIDVLSDARRFTSLNGDIRTQWKKFIGTVRASNPTGVHLAVSDAQSSAPGPRQEYLNTHFFVSQCIVAIGCLAHGGRFCCKVFDTVTLLTGEILWVLSHLFESVTMIKPISSQWAASDRFVVCEGFLPDVTSGSYVSVDKWMDVLTDAIELEWEDEGSHVLSLFGETNFTRDFVDWMLEHNTMSLSTRYTVARQVIDLTPEEKQNVANRVSPYDLEKCFILWNIPGTPSDSFTDPDLSDSFSFAILLKKSLPEISQYADFLHSRLGKQANPLVPPFNMSMLPDHLRYLFDAVVINSGTETAYVDNHLVFRDIRLELSDVNYEYLDTWYTGDPTYKHRNMLLVMIVWDLFSILGQDSPKVDISYMLSETKFNITTDLMSGPMNSAGVHSLGLFPVDTLFGTYETIYDKDLQLQNGNLLVDLSPISNIDTSRTLQEIILSLMGRKEHPFVVVVELVDPKISIGDNESFKSSMIAVCVMGRYRVYLFSKHVGKSSTLADEFCVALGLEPSRSSHTVYRNPVDSYEDFHK